MQLLAGESHRHETLIRESCWVDWASQSTVVGLPEAFRAQPLPSVPRIGNMESNKVILRIYNLVLFSLLDFGLTCYSYPFYLAYFSLLEWEWLSYALAILEWEWLSCVLAILEACNLLISQAYSWREICLKMNHALSITHIWFRWDCRLWTFELVLKWVRLLGLLA